ncbi:hypothetical protein EYF80_039647 [Liparis tanakae]|uniref:Uncharacterized protein n=1 Tax=Liparis tanakae TaxID=230148 RepID=A0A4Z2G9H6_9TELE|nr:hypothetical protein EYF80_039647 [Liparis tanakae]
MPYKEFITYDMIDMIACKGNKKRERQAAARSAPPGLALLSCVTLICSAGPGSTSGQLLSACQRGRDWSDTLSTFNQHPGPQDAERQGNADKHEGRRRQETQGA